MPEEKVRVLKEGLPSLHDMETDDLVDYLLRARQIFVDSLTQKDPPLDERSLLLETASFDEAVRRILSEKSSVVSPEHSSDEAIDGDDSPVPEEESADHSIRDRISQDIAAEEGADVSLDSYLAERDQDDEDIILLEEKPLFAEQPLLEKLTRSRAPDAQRPRPQNAKTGWSETDTGMEQGGIDLDDFSPLRRGEDRSPDHRSQSPDQDWDRDRDRDIDLHREDRDPSPYVWDSDVDERSSGGFIGFVSGLIVLAVYITLPALALVSPLLTPAMAWAEWINISILSGVVLLAVFVCALFSRYRFRYALYGGIAFALLSSGAHYIPVVRDFVKDEKIILPLASYYLIEGYFQLAEESQLPLKTGAIQLQPNELNYSRAQRVNLFVKEVDSWLEN